MLKVLLHVSRLIDNLSERIGGVSVYLVIITVAVGFYNVLVRYMGQFIGVQLSSNLFIEMQWYLYSLVFFLGFAYILKNGINVRVDFIYANWSRKRQAMLDFWGNLFLLVPYCVIGIWVTVNPVMTSWRQWEMSPDPDGLPRAPLKTMIIVAFAFLLLQAISELIKLYAVLRGEDEETLDLTEHQEALRIE
ncbi:MAG: TRAP transporter small permease subunit [Caldilineaceae bacterium]|nr:TRAP transporter small permease subunit [Caldilineaceae bacterium]